MGECLPLTAAEYGLERIGQVVIALFGSHVRTLPHPLNRLYLRSHLWAFEDRRLIMTGS
jgi:hypothetical protein